jgi:membrane protein implicated in regulation of membrane protease activity
MLKNLLRLLGIVVDFSLATIMGLLSGTMYIMVFHILFLDTNPSLFPVNLWLRTIVFGVFNIIIIVVTLSFAKDQNKYSLK